MLAQEGASGQLDSSGLWLAACSTVPGVEYDGTPRQGSRPRARGSASRPLGLFRRVRRQGHGLCLNLPPEVVAELGVEVGQHVYLALVGDGTVRLVNAASLAEPSAELVKASESRAALQVEVRRLRRKLAARRLLVACYAYHQGRQDEYFRWQPGAIRAPVPSPPILLALAARTAAARPEPESSPSAAPG